MALTFTPTTRHVYSIGDRKEAIIDLGVTGAPGTSGDALTAAALGFNQIDVIDVSGNLSLDDGSEGWSVAIIYPATAFVTSVTVFLQVQGTAGAGNPLIETTDTVGASGSVRLRVVGKGPIVGAAS